MYEVDTFWQCDSCGYSNAGSDRCVMCNARGPLATEPVTNGSSADPEGDDAEAGAWDVREWRKATYAPPTAPSKRTSRKNAKRASRTVVTVILLNLVLQGVGFFVAFSAGMQGVALVKFTLLFGLVFFTMVALFVLARSAEMGLRPTLLRGSRFLAVGEGVLVGGGLAIVLTLLWRLLAGRAVVDPSSLGLAAEGSITLLLFGIVVVVVAAPVVEELVFRGFFAEAFRQRGPWIAITFSAVAFSLAHLRFAQFVYFFIGGLVLGLVYWRRGLLGSIGAHATFNGMLLVFALAVVAGPPVEVTAGDSRLTLPGHWQEVEVTGDDVAATGPLGAQFELLHIAMPSPVSAHHLATAFATSSVPMPPEITVDPTTVAVTDIPAGQAVSFTADVYGLRGRVVMLPRDDTLWIMSLQTQGSARADRDFNDILWSWSLS